MNEGMQQEQAEDVIRFHRYLYYAAGRPMLTDREYDRLERELRGRFPGSTILRDEIECPVELYPRYAERQKLIDASRNQN